MALPSTGSISMSQVNVELKRPATQTLSMNDAEVRKIAGKPTGTFSMSDLRGKTYTVSVNTQLVNRDILQDGYFFNINYNIFSAYLQIANSAGTSRVYYGIDGGSSGNVNPNETVSVPLPQGYGRRVGLSLPHEGIQRVTVQLIGEVIP